MSNGSLPYCDETREIWRKRWDAERAKGDLEMAAQEAIVQINCTKFGRKGKKDYCRVCEHLRMKPCGRCNYQLNSMSMRMGM